MIRVKIPGRLAPLRPLVEYEMLDDQMSFGSQHSTADLEAERKQIEEWERQREKERGQKDSDKGNPR